MASKKTTVIGSLTLILTVSIITVIFLGGAKIDIAKDYTRFSLNENGIWVTKATERNLLYDQNGILLKKTSTVLNKTITSNGLFASRVSTYTNGAVIKDVYFFEDTQDITKFPASHWTNVKNCGNCRYVWEVRDLSPVTKSYRPESPLTFGRMKLEWYGGFAQLTKTRLGKGYLRVTNDMIPTDFNFYSRVFDPPAQTSGAFAFTVPYEESYQVIYVMSFNTTSI